MTAMNKILEVDMLVILDVAADNAGTFIAVCDHDVPPIEKEK